MTATIFQAMYPEEATCRTAGHRLFLDYASLMVKGGIEPRLKRILRGFEHEPVWDGNIRPHRSQSRFPCGLNRGGVINSQVVPPHIWHWRLIAA